MKKITLLGLVAILAIAVEGCTIGDDNKETITPKSSPTTQNLAETPNQPKETKKDSNTPRPQRVSGLIPATNPDVRVSGSVRGRQDPFALVSLRPEIEKIEKETKRNSEPNFPTSRKGNNIPENITGVPTIDSLGNQGNQAKKSELILAEQLIVTGIVKLGGVTKVIVKAPDEAYTRHVGIGEYVSNGRILIKGIEGINSSTPKVILQQKGVQIRKGVGEQPVIENDLESDITAQGIKELSGKPLNASETWLPNFLSRKLKDSKNN